MMLLRTRRELVCIKYRVLLDGERGRQIPPSLPAFNRMKLIAQNVGNSVNNFRVLSWCKLHVPGMEE